LRSGNSACVNGAAEFLRQTVTTLPKHIRISLARGDAGFGDASVQTACEALGLDYIFVAKLTQKVQSLCRHGDEHWRKTDVAGLEVQEWNWSSRDGASSWCVNASANARTPVAKRCSSWKAIAFKHW
jgi:Transposase DDE domain group 1